MTKELRVKFEVKGQRITWFCIKCGGEIKRDNGYITCDDGEALRLMKTDFTEGPFGTLDLKALMLADYPRWISLHKDCDDSGRPADYWFEVSSCNTMKKLIHWTGHLMGKGWIGCTDWDQILYTIGHE
ncbi:hypothetical protein [Nocardia neocaledoniensis]|uniref:hypothetical protein n=1 Tax=Nocardia neocaledoniensis TaxID=236511 RepID=UPI00245525D8|nr:hypothetical protein [Nocardia neocaledoniensis]